MTDEQTLKNTSLRTHKGLFFAISNLTYKGVPATISQLKDKSRLSYAYTSRLLSLYDDKKFIKKQYKGRETHVTLTKKGEEFLKLLQLVSQYVEQ